MNITDLFCTPEQGKRLKELVPELTSAFVWYVTPNMKKLHQNRSNGCQIGDQNTPALTLQELRDVIKRVNEKKWERDNTFLLESFDYHELENLLDVGTAPELAAWVIERLEGER